MIHTLDEIDLLINKAIKIDEIDRKIDEISLAYEKERQNIEQLEEGLTNTLTNDAYFKNQQSIPYIHSTKHIA